jgi:uncharacterized protein (DUF952 family)
VIQHRQVEESRKAGVTYHLVPGEIWKAARAQEEYLPEAFASDGFIHCTNGTDLLTSIANMFYVGDPRPFTVLAIRMADVRSEVRYDDRDGHFPHIYGPLNTDAVIGELDVERDESGRFIAIGNR